MEDAIAQRCLLTARYMLGHQATIRQTAAAFGLSKSGVHKDLMCRLPQLDPTLYRQVHALLQYHKAIRHLRGGEATKRRYAQRAARKSQEGLHFPENTVY